MEIRSLIPYYVFSVDPALRRKYIRGIKRLRDKLPFIYAEEAASPEAAAALEERFQGFFEQADPKNWHAAPAPNGQGVQIWNDPPSSRTSEAEEQRQGHADLQRYLALCLWASKSLEAGALDPTLTIADGLAIAREIDQDDLFDQARSISEFQELQRAAAVAGAAYVIARFAEDSFWDAETATWCLDVTGRAAVMPESLEEFGSRGSILMMHPVVFAAHGYAALLMRGLAVGECQAGLLSLAVDASEGVVAAVASSVNDYASSNEVFVRVLLWVLLQTSIEEDGVMPNFDSLAWDLNEANRKLALLDEAELALASGSVPEFPPIPLPWFARDLPNPRHPETKGYEPNSSHFMWHLAEKTLLRFPFDVLLAPAQRPDTIRLVAGLVARTLQEIQPPFADSRREHQGNTPFEWVYAFFNWCGRIAAKLEPDEVRVAILDPIKSKHTDTALLAFTSFAPAFMIDCFLPPRSFRADMLPVWEELSDWILDTPDARHLDDDFLSSDFSGVALAALFCVHRDFGPVLCGIDEGWEHIPAFIPMLEKAVRVLGKNETLFHSVILLLKKGGMSLSPKPGLYWLLELAVEKKADIKFWRGSGEDTVE